MHPPNPAGTGGATDGLGSEPHGTPFGDLAEWTFQPTVLPDRYYAGKAPCLDQLALLLRTEPVHIRRRE